MPATIHEQDLQMMQLTKLTADVGAFDSSLREKVGRLQSYIAHLEEHREL